MSQPNFTVRGVAAQRAAAAELFSRQIPTTKPARQQAAGTERHLHSPIRPFQSRPISNLPVFRRPILSCLLPARASTSGRIGRNASLRALGRASLQPPCRPRSASPTFGRLASEKKSENLLTRGLTLVIKVFFFRVPIRRLKSWLTLLHYTARRVEQLP